MCRVTTSLRVLICWLGGGKEDAGDGHAGDQQEDDTPTRKGYREEEAFEVVQVKILIRSGDLYF